MTTFRRTRKPRRRHSVTKLSELKPRTRQTTMGRSRKPKGTLAERNARRRKPTSTPLEKKFEFHWLCRIGLLEDEDGIDLDALEAIELEAQWYFDPDSFRRFDYAHPATQVAIECEGGIAAHNRGQKKSRHATIEGFDNDAWKYNDAARLGWAVLRFTTTMLDDPAAVVRAVYGTIQARRESQDASDSAGGIPTQLG